MSASLKERLFFLNNDCEVNKLVFKIGGVFMAVLTGILTAAYFDLFKVTPYEVLQIMGLLFITEIIFFILLKLKAPVGFIKYYGLLAMELCMVIMISNAYFGVYITYIIVPVISCLYFDRRLTLNITVLCYIGMLIALWFRAPGAIALAFPNYTRNGWFIAFGLGYTLEYLAVSAVLFAITKRSRRYMEKLYHHNEKLGEIQSKIIYRFADLIESRDDSTGKHVKRTSKYVAMTANLLCKEEKYKGLLDEEIISNIEMAAPLHDIGKIAISDLILLKPARLSDEEFEIIKTHTTQGKKIIDSAMAGIERDEFIKIAADIALSHHEKWDGSGYPNGLSGENISLPARIMAVADVFDALVSDRCYKKGITADEAFATLEEGKGKHFDPHIVDVFIAAKDEVLQILNET